MRNLVDILKYCPKNTKFYCTLIGDVYLRDVSEENIIVSDNNTPNTTLSLNEFGQNSLYKNSECLLFPSKEQRDWSKFNPSFRLPIYNGNILMTLDGSVFITNGIIDENNGIGYYCGLDSSNKFKISTMNLCWTNDFYIPATEYARKKLFNKIKKAGFNWDNSKNKLRYNFKPFDKVLVRQNENTKWSCDIFSNYLNGTYCYNCIGFAYKYCIPFKGNEDLLGTTLEPAYYGD